MNPKHESFCTEREPLTSKTPRAATAFPPSRCVCQEYGITPKHLFECRRLQHTKDHGIGYKDFFKAFLDLHTPRTKNCVCCLN